MNEERFYFLYDDLQKQVPLAVFFLLIEKCTRKEEGSLKASHAPPDYTTKFITSQQKCHTNQDYVNSFWFSDLLYHSQLNLVNNKLIEKNVNLHRVFITSIQTPVREQQRQHLERHIKDIDNNQREKEETTALLKRLNMHA